MTNSSPPPLKCIEEDLFASRFGGILLDKSVMVRLSYIFAFSLVLTLAACAGTDTRRDTLDSVKERGFLFHAYERGFRYYQPAVFILVYTNNDGGLITEHKILPDRSRKMSAHPYTFIAANDIQLDFKDGILTTAKSDADATAFPKALITAAEQAASAAVKAGVLDIEPKKPKLQKVPGPYIFRLVYRAGKVVLVGTGGTELTVAVPRDQGAQTK